jgi:hypothetical protein
MKFGLLILLAEVLICSHVHGWPQSYNLEAQRLAVAKIRVRHAESGVQTGAAIYVGNDKQYGYFVTAYHNIDPERGGSIESIELQIFNSPQFLKAEPVDKFDSDLDLGIIKTNLTNIPSQIKQLFAKEPIPATAIRIIGHPASGDWSVWSGRVENENAPQGDSRHFIVNRDSSLAPGYSGGGLFDMDGNFLGMHLETTTFYGRELKSREIQNLLEAFRVPTNNFGQNVPISSECSPDSRPVPYPGMKAINENWLSTNGKLSLTTDKPVMAKYFYVCRYIFPKPVVAVVVTIQEGEIYFSGPNGSGGGLGLLIYDGEPKYGRTWNDFVGPQNHRPFMWGHEEGQRQSVSLKDYRVDLEKPTAHISVVFALVDAWSEQYVDVWMKGITIRFE